MHTTRFRAGPAQQATRLRRNGRILLAVAGLVTALLASACDTSEQVPWATYSSGLQPRIDAATATGDCAALRAFLTAAKTDRQLAREGHWIPERRSRVLHPGRPAPGGLPGREQLTGWAVRHKAVTAQVSA